MNINYKEKLRNLALDSEIRYYLDSSSICESIDNKNIETTTQSKELTVSGNTISIPRGLELNEQNEHELLKVSIIAVGAAEHDAEARTELISHIAGYLACKTEAGDISESTFAGKTFSLLSPYSNPIENVIAEIAQVLSDNTLSKMLLYADLDNVANCINIKTNTRTLGSRFKSLFTQLNEAYKELTTLTRITDSNDSLYKNKLNRISELLKNNRTYIFEPMSANMLERNNFSLRKTFIKDEIGEEEELTPEEIAIIRKHVEIFNAYGKNFRDGTKNLFIPISQYTFIDKVNSAVLFYKCRRELAEIRFLNLWRKIQKLITESIIPAAYTHSHIETFDIDKIVKLGSYGNKDANSFNLNTNNKVQKLKQQIDKEQL